MIEEQSLTMKAKDFLLDLFFPKKCVSCGKIDTFLCDKCLRKIVFIKSPVCLGCGRLSENGKFCPRCRPKNHLKGVVIAAHFEEGPLKELIHSFKYESLKGLDQTLANFLAAALKRYNFKTDYLISYVPLHRSRYHWRGYNQSELLAKKTAEAMNMYFLKNLLRKKKKTKYQIQLKRKERLLNLNGVFEVNKKVALNCHSGLDPESKNKILNPAFAQLRPGGQVQNDKTVSCSSCHSDPIRISQGKFHGGIFLKNKKIIIVDDVVTTGTTLNECAKVLKEAGAKEVWGLVLGKH